jgi:hypothetical protein
LKESDEVRPIGADAPLICVDFLPSPDTELGIEHLLDRGPWIARRHRRHGDGGLHTFVEILLSVSAIAVIQMQAPNIVLI